MRSTILKYVILAFVAFSCLVACAQTSILRISGVVLDPAGEPVAGAHVAVNSGSAARRETITDGNGRFDIALQPPGSYTVQVQAAGFTPVVRRFSMLTLDEYLHLQLMRIASSTQQVVVTASVGEVTFASPDPSQKVMVREDLLDANPGRPGAPVSIPGLPIETASGGIKAPQYFAPGVAGDHGEPIAQYIAAGSYLVPNNLSANAHGNGYADPNLLIPATLGNVETDGGAFNVLEGNHALNLAVTYTLRPQLQHIITLTGDGRDLDIAAVFAPADPSKKEWLALEAAYGNGLLQRLEHRQQYKWNAMRTIDRGRHALTLLSLGYYGNSYIDGLVPLGMSMQLHDTVDSRQQDQTHTTVIAASDDWMLRPRDAISISGFFRTYNLALFSNFGEGLIRQSEFRTADGAEARLTHTFAPRTETTDFQVMTGVSYAEDDPRRDNLDHYLFGNEQVYGPFVKIMANNLSIRDLAPYFALRGDLGSHLHFYAGLRHDQIQIENTDLLHSMRSFNLWKGIENPKATLAWTPGSLHWLPSASFSIGQAFFTQDPRIGTAPSTTGPAQAASPLERSHSQQLVVEKMFAGTDLLVTLGHTTTTSTLAKIDPDTGLEENQGPGTLRFLSATLRHQFAFGSLQAVFSKADARDQSTGIVTPEAPRTIFDALAALDRLPFNLHARGEYEYVGHRLLDIGGFEAVPIGETRLAVMRPFFSRHWELAANAMFGRGYTGQTTSNFAPDWQPGGPPPACAANTDGITNNFACDSVERSIGIRLPSFVGAIISYHFGDKE